MKRIIVMLLVLAMVFAAVSVRAEALAGGWEWTDFTEPIPEEAMAAFDKAMEEFVGVGYKPVALLGTQLVAGTNYYFLCMATPVVPDPVPHWATVTVYADLDGNAEIISITALDPYPPVEE